MEPPAPGRVAAAKGWARRCASSSPTTPPARLAARFGYACAKAAVLTASNAINSEITSAILFISWRLLLLNLDVGVADDRSVALLLPAHEARHLIRGACHRVHAERREALLHVVGQQRLLDLGRQAQQHLARRARGRRIADPP